MGKTPRLLGFLLAALLFGALASPAQAYLGADGAYAQSVSPCDWDGNPAHGCQPFNASHPMPTTGTINGGNVGGYNSGPVASSATPASSSHAAGTAVGAVGSGSQTALFTLAVARAGSAFSGGITLAGVRSAGGFTGGYWVYIWDKLPANTTCKDNTAFAGSATDDAFQVTPPFQLLPALGAAATVTYASLTGVFLSYKNADTVPGQNLYVCLVAIATDTADESAAVQVTLAGPQD